MSSQNGTDKQPLRCIIIGAGVSGILIGCKLKEAFGDKVAFQMLEKNADVGGTWLENRYPESHISFKSKVNSAEWNEQKSTWTLNVEGKGQYECDVLINAGGILNNFQYPKLKNIDKFSGPLMHTAAWDSDVDIRGKKVAIIGAGASAIQALPALQQHVSHVNIYIRTPSWIMPPAGGTANGERNHKYTPEELAQFRDDPEYSLKFRKSLEDGFNKMFSVFFKGGDEQKKWRTDIEQSMKKIIVSPKLQEKLIPSFDLGCRRTNPGEPYLEAIQKENVTPIFDEIEEVTTNGIIAGGQEHLVDVIIAATGFDTSFRPRFPIVGRDGIDLRELWKDDPISYLGVAVSGFPNYLTFLGPNTPISNGSLMGSVEATADYFIRILTKMMNQNVSSFNIRPEVQKDFDSYTQEYMQNMVWTGTCRSWYKRSADGKITALWPGSSLHYIEVLEDNRWEDFEWRYKSNRFSYWGKGFSRAEMAGDGKSIDYSHYMKSHPNLPLEAYYLASKGYQETFEVAQTSVFSPGSTPNEAESL